jgi:hypothetical protein
VAEANLKLDVYSFVRTGNTKSGTVDIAAVARWLRSAGWFGNVTIGNDLRSPAVRPSEWRHGYDHMEKASWVHSSQV